MASRVNGGPPGQGEPLLQVERGPMTMSVQIERKPGGDWIVLRFATAQGENEFWFTTEAAQGFARAVMQAATGIMLPGPGGLLG